MEEALEFVFGSLRHKMNTTHALHLLTTPPLRSNPAAITMRGLVFFLGIGTLPARNTGARILECGLQQLKDKTTLDCFEKFVLGRALMERIPPKFDSMPERARQLLVEACNAGVIYAWNAIATIDLCLFGVDKIHYMYEEGCNGGDTYAMYNSVCTTTVIEPVFAYEMYQRVADNGNAVGCVGLATVLCSSNQIGPPCQEAVEFLSRALSQGSIHAMYDVAYLIHSGRIQGTQRDAFQLFYAAAVAGHVHAMGFVALMLCRGLGCEPDHQAALVWIQRSMLLRDV